MARAQNFAYASPWDSIGKSLGVALFGDPEAAAKQRDQVARAAYLDAQSREADAHAGLYGSQTTGQNYQNRSAASLPELIASLVPQQPGSPPPMVMPSDPLAALPDTPAGPAPGTFNPHDIGAVIAALAGQQGDKVDMGETIGSLGAMMGNDEFARRGLIAQGHTPDKDFALTPERADTIAAQGYDAKLREGTSVATINHATDISIANIKDRTARRGQDIGASTARRGQDVGATTARRGQDIKGEVGFSLVSDVLPGARMTSGERSPEHNREVDGAPGSYHLPGDGVEAYDIEPGTGARTFADAHAAMKAKYGARLVEAIDETNRPGHRPHWHFAVQTPPKAAKTAKTAAPKGINKASNKLIDDELSAQLTANHINPTPGARTMMKSRVIAGFQQTGNHVGAVSTVIADVKKRYAELHSSGQPPVQGARKAPDGRWYVQRGKNPDGSPAYARVDG